MIKQLFSVVSDFLNLIIAVIVLLIFKNQIVHVGIRLYELAWVVIVVALIGAILLKPKETKVLPVFPREFVKRIENSLPHDAIKLYQSWLLMSLDKCYRICQKKQSNESLLELAKTITDKLVFIFDRIPKDSLYKVLEERNKDNAFIALIFFTTLIRALETNAVIAIFRKSISAYRAVFTQITLENSSHFLFREHYRLYELGALVGGKRNSLNFNSDIEPLLRSVLEPQLFKGKRQAIQKSHAGVGNKSTGIESKVVTPCSQEKNETEQEKKKNPVVQETVVELQKESLGNINSIEIERCQKFFKWLQRQINRRPINTDQYFYQDCKEHEQSKLFLTETAFADFYKKTQIVSNKVVAALVSLNHSDGKVYQLKKEGHSNKPLVSITIDFEVKAQSELNGTIEEVL